ncbi:unnamed protein product [Ranitomeya imitator]|uniref:leucine--tRNA ligase n=1 Tax=Ranitomeya imitator TaxID=111125 RepID=A0ABN9LMK0_9NEOB|nr:unnamed protein product [Ranitomeya imitator]
MRKKPFLQARHKQSAEVDDAKTGEKISAFAFNPEAIYGASHIAILPSHRLLHGDSKVKGALQEAFVAGNDCLTRVSAVNLFTKQELPLLISAKHEFEGYLDCKIGIPSTNLDDAMLADILRIPYAEVTEVLKDGTERITNSAKVCTANESFTLELEIPYSE